MKILFVIDNLKTGGAQRQLVNLAVAFKRSGNFVSIGVYCEGDYYDKILNQNNINIIKLIVNNPLKRIPIFRRFIRDGNFDVVLSYLGVPNFICELAAIPFKRWKLIVNERSADPFILKSFNSKLRRLFHFFADVIVCNSYTNKNIILKVNPFIREKKIKVIYNLIDLKVWKPDATFNYCKDGILNLLIAASHRKLKNMIGLLQGLLLLNKEERRKIRINWYGNNLTPPFYDESIADCRKFIQENDLESIINIFPADQNIREKMQDADIIGLFSVFEGLPNSICEGMALGKPVLASAVSDIPLFIRDGINGKLCNPADTQSIADTLRYFCNIERETLKEMGRINREKAIELFDENKNYAKYLELM